VSELPSPADEHVPATSVPFGPPDLWADGLGRAGVRSVQVLAVTALAGVLLWIITRIPLVVIPVVVALILAAAISPLVGWLTTHGLPRALAVLASFIAILAVFGGAVSGIIVLIRAQTAELTGRVLAGVDQLHAWLNNGPVPVSDQEIAGVRESIQKFFSSSGFGAEALTGLRTAGEVLAGMVLMAVILFFFLKDGPKIRTFVFGFLPARHRATAAVAAQRSTRVLGGYVRGTAVIAAINALIVGLALAGLQVPLALPLAAFVFVGGFIPIIGATAAGTLAVVTALVSNGPGTAGIVLAVLIGSNQLEHHILQPVLMGKVLNIHGLSILLALAAGTTLAGIIGALLAVPLTAVGWTVFKTWTGRWPLDSAHPER
jgi:predicted PurR-regulated permease PerM